MQDRLERTALTPRESISLFLFLGLTALSALGGILAIASFAGVDLKSLPGEAFGPARTLRSLGREVVATLLSSVGLLGFSLLVATRCRPSEVRAAWARVNDMLLPSLGFHEHEGKAAIRQIRERLRAQQEMEVQGDKKNTYNKLKQIAQLWSLRDLQSGFVFRHPLYGDNDATVCPRIPFDPATGIASSRLIFVTDDIAGSPEATKTAGKSENLLGVFAGLLRRNERMVADADAGGHFRLVDFTHLVWISPKDFQDAQEVALPDSVHAMLLTRIKTLAALPLATCVFALDVFSKWSETEFRRFVLLLIQDPRISLLNPTIFLVAPSTASQSVVEDIRRNRILKPVYAHHLATTIEGYAPASPNGPRWIYEVITPHTAVADYKIQYARLKTGRTVPEACACYFDLQKIQNPNVVERDALRDKLSEGVAP